MIKHRFTTPITDDSDPDKIQPSDWNDAHVMAIISADPVAPNVGDFWMRETGTSPDRTLEFRLCDTDGTIVTLFAVTR